MITSRDAVFQVRFASDKAKSHWNPTVLQGFLTSAGTNPAEKMLSRFQQRLPWISMRATGLRGGCG